VEGRNRNLERGTKKKLSHCVNEGPAASHFEERELREEKHQNVSSYTEEDKKHFKKVWCERRKEVGKQKRGADKSGERI